MDKRTFLQTSSAILTGTILSGIAGCRPGKEPLTNWAGNLAYSTNRIDFPATVEEAVEIVKKSPKLRPLGSQHSFNTIADSEEKLVSSKRLNRIISLDEESMSVTVEAGIKYGELIEYLHKHGYALHNLASLPHISVAGSVATATHGSGVKNGNLATGVSAIEFINAAGNVVRLSTEDGELFNGAVVNLGALGFVTRLTLDLRPTFNMKQVVYRNLPMEQLRENFHAIMSSGYSVSLFTNWRNRNINQVWIKYLADAKETPAPEFYGARLAERNMHPVEDQSAESCTEQMGVAGPWFERLPHFKMGFTPSTGKELQSEYFVPLENGYEALMAVEKLHSKIEPHLFISEIRTIDADNLWMSPCYKKACVAIHTTWKQDWNSVVNLLPLMEKQLVPFNPRPHWGKLFTLQPSVLHARIEQLGEFRKLVERHDPEGKFRNAFLKKNIFNQLA
jgi:xylitol oxidase